VIGLCPAAADHTALTKNPNADPAAVKAAADLRQTMFVGDSLRAMLLNAYAFGTWARLPSMPRSPRP
jgi:hypothetical protein